MPVSATTLRQAIVQSFSLSELKVLCFEMNIDFENLGEGGLEVKALSLITYVQRRGLYDQLVTAVQNARPHLELGAQPSPHKESSGAVATGSAPTSGQSGPTYNFYGPVTGSAIGEGSVNADNIAGRDINITHNYTEPTNKAEFAEQLAQLEALLKEALANGEIRDDTAVADIQDAIEEAQKPTPRIGRLKRRLEDIKEVVEGAGGIMDAARKTGTAVVKALPIISGLIKVVTTIF